MSRHVDDFKSLRVSYRKIDFRLAECLIILLCSYNFIK